MEKAPNPNRQEIDLIKSMGREKGMNNLLDIRERTSLAAEGNPIFANRLKNIDQAIKELESELEFEEKSK
jgi:hypothetical protein